jgi:cell division protease FtsH
VTDAKHPPQREGPQGGDKPEPGPAPFGWWRLGIWVIVLTVLLLALWWAPMTPPVTPVAYSELKAAIRAGEVEEVTLQGHSLSGLYRDAPPGEERFVSEVPVLEGAELLALLEEQGVRVHVEPERTSLAPLLILLLPLLFLILLFVFGARLLRRQMGGMEDRLTGFGRSRAQRFERGTASETFEDVAGLDNAKTELREIIEFLKDPARFQALGAQVPRGVLLMGPPGTGKTLLARAVAGEAQVPFFSISGSEFIELFVGVGASRVRDMFETARKEAPAILFIDEIDSVGRARGTGLGGGHDEREQTLNQILAAMDGFSPHEAVVVMAATNRPDVLDSALLRPGRFDRKITLELPQRPARRKILGVHTRKVPTAGDVDLDDLAARTVGFSGADLRNLVNEAALLAARKGKKQVEREDFEAARDKILFGGEREDLIIEKEKRRVACHEAGHALAARLLPGTDPLAKVTIIPRGRALGATEQTPEEDRFNLTRQYLLSRLAVMLAGRAAERVVFDDLSSGAEDDLRQATQLARRMVCQWGMSDEVGPVSYRLGEEHVFLGREMAQARDFSEATGRLVDAEIQRLLREAEERARDLLAENRAGLDALTDALLERETLFATEVDEALGLAAGSRAEARL